MFLCTEAWLNLLLSCVQGTLPLKELSICNLQQNCNHSQPQEFAFQINGKFDSSGEDTSVCWHRALECHNHLFLTFIGCVEFIESITQADWSTNSASRSQLQTSDFKNKRHGGWIREVVSICNFNLLLILSVIPLLVVCCVLSYGSK